MMLRLATSEKDSNNHPSNDSASLYSHQILLRLEHLDPGEDSEMEPFDRWTKIRRRFKRILWLEDYHDLDDLLKGHLGCCRST